jgi:hypothetical protein
MCEAICRSWRSWVSYSNGELYGIRMALGASLGDMRMSILMRTPNLAVIGMAWD